MTRAVFFGDTPHRLAGSQRSLLAAIAAGRELGLEPVMVFPAPGAMVDACRDAGLPVHIVEGTAAFTTFGKALLRLGPLGQARVAATEMLPYARRLARLVEAEHADVVHFNTARGALMAGLGAHIAGRDVVLHVRGSPAIGRSMWAAAQAMAGRIVLVARALERCLAPSARSRARVVYNGVVVPAEQSRAGARAAARLVGVPAAWMDSDTPVLVSLSSLVPFKGLHHLVRAIALLRDAGVHARFVLAGTGLGDGYERWLRRLPDDLGVGDRVAFVGFVEHVAPLLFACDALVLPSVETEQIEIDGAVIDVRGNEGLPRSVLDAMAAGRVVVATDIAGVREQVEPGRTGLLVAPGDVRGLVDALGRIVGDAAFRRSAGEAGRELVRARFGVAAAGRGLVDALREAAARRSLATRARDAFRVALDTMPMRRNLERA